MTKKIFRFRAFTALMMLWSFILESVTGIVLYIVPPGRVANWTNWKLWGFTKHQWAAMHTIFGYVFLVFAVIHIYFNWKPIINYMKRKLKAGLRMRIELAASFLVSFLVLIATVIGIPPFSSIMDLGESFKNSWEDSQRQPFVPHAELLSFRQFIRDIGISEVKAVEILGENGILIQDKEKLIQDIARSNGISPADIYSMLKNSLSEEERHKVDQVTSGARSFTGRGYGWKTVENLAQEMNVPLDQILEKLKSKGIDAEKDEVLRNLAERHGMKAVDLVNLIQEKD